MIRKEFSVIQWNLPKTTRYVIQRSLFLQDTEFKDYYSSESGPYMFSIHLEYAKTFRFRWMAIKKMNKLDVMSFETL